jgi:hypothetical protein
MTKAQLTLTSLVATLLCLVCFAPGVAQAAFTHKYLRSIEPFGRVIGVGVGPAEPKPAAEPGAVYVADHNVGVVERFSAAGAKLPFECNTPACAKYIAGNKLEGTPTGALNEGHDALEGGVAVNDETGEVFVSDSAVVDVFAPTGEFLGQIRGPETPCVFGGAGCVNPGTRAPCKEAEAGCVVLFTGTVGLAFDQETHELYVGDVSETAGVTNVVDVFATEAGGGSKFKSQLGAGVLSRGGLGPSIAVVESGLAGTVYVGEPVVGLVYVFGSLGTLEATWTGAKTPAKSFGGQGFSVAIDPGTGNVFVMDGGNRVVDEFPGSVFEEKPLGTVKGTPTGPGGSLVPFNFRSQVAVAPEGGDVYVGNESVVDQFGPDLTIPDVEVGPSPVFAIEPATHTWSATLNGKVDPDAAGPATCEFEYGTTSAYGQHAACSAPVAEGNALTPVKSKPETITGLPPGTVFFYRLDATNDANKETNTGQGAEDEGSFITPGPIIEKASASDVASSSATLNVMVNPNNAPTSVHFEYGRCSGGTESCSSSAFESSTTPKAIGSGDSPVGVEPHVQGLAPGTVYHYRVIASSEIAAGVSEEFEAKEGTFTTQSPGEFSLIDGRGWEMVSQAQKEGALIYGFGEPQGILQAAAQGGAMTYRANVPTEPGVVGYANSMQVLSTRSSSTGWSSKDLPSPHATAIGASGGHEYGEEYRFFSEDLSRGVLQSAGPFQPCHDSQGKPQPCFTPEASEQTAFERDLQTGEYTPLVTGCPSEPAPCPPAIKEHANVEPGVVFGKTGQAAAFVGEPCPPVQYCGPFFAGASPDAKHVVLASTVTQLTSQPGSGLYEWSAGRPPSEQLRYVSELPGNGGGEHEAAFGAHGGSPGVGENARHAISGDGSRVFWTAKSSNDLYLRNNATRPQSRLGAQGECLEPANACTIQLGNGPAEFETASSDGSRVFFSEGGSAHDQSLAECEIVEGPGGPSCNESGQPTDLGEGGEGPDHGFPGSVIGASEDGSVIYWVAANNDLYMDRYSAGKWQRTLIAALSGEDRGNWSQSVWGLTARVSPNGEWLAFSSERSLTGYDNQDVSEVESPIEPVGLGGRLPRMTKVHHDEEVFEYHAGSGGAGSLTCASCDPTGARPVGEEAGLAVNSFQEGGLRTTVINPADYEFWEAFQWLAGDLPGGEAFEGGAARYQPRALSNEGRLFFDSGSALVPKDINGAWDVYEYEPENVPAGGEHPCTPSSTSGSVVFKPAHAFEAEGRKGEEGAGCVGLISSGESTQDSVFFDASENGSEVFFLTTSKLSSQDFDNAYDVYDAHECTSASPCVAPPPGPGPECGTAEACRVAPNPPPGIYGAPASATFNGLGNLTPPPPPAVVKKVTKKAAKCKRGFVKKKVKKKETCVKVKSKKKAKKTNRKGK